MNNIRWYWIFFISLVIAFIFLGNGLRARWWVIDDHEIINYLGDDRKISFFEMFEIMKSTEIGQIGKSQRFRPVYYILRMLEMFFWGYRPHLWYLSRLLVFWIGFSICWFLTSRLVNVFIALVFTFYVFSFKFWVDIFLRLGPSEIYAFLGFFVFTYGFYRILLARNKSISLNTFLVCIGTVLSVGSKENMVILFFPLIYLLIWLNMYHRKNVLALFFSILAILFCLFVGAVVMKSMLVYGQDIYTQSTSLTIRLVVFRQGLVKIVNNKYFVLSFCSFLFIFFIIKIYLKKVYKFLKRDVMLFIFGWVLIVVFYLFQYVFYNGNWPLGNRYDFPGMLTVPVVILYLFICIKKIMLGFKFSYLVKIIDVILFLLLCLLTLRNGYKHINVAISKNVVRTNKFSLDIEEISDIVKSDVSTPIVFFSNAIVDFEPLESVRRFLRADGVKNKIYINPLICNNLYSGDWEKYLQKNICSLIDGNSGFMPLDELDSTKYFCVGFSGSGFSKNCINGRVLFDYGMNYSL